MRKSQLETMTDAFKDRKNNVETLAAVRKRYPTTGLKLETVNWYRNKFRRAGMDIPSETELR